jgi:hypothetical protein
MANGTTRFIQALNTRCKCYFFTTPKWSWVRRGLSALATGILISLAVPTFIDQGYLRYKAWAVPCLVLFAIILYAISALFTPAVQSYGRRIIGIGRRAGIALFIVLLVVFLAVVTGCSWLVLSWSRQHVDEARHAGLAAAVSTLSNTESGRSVPLPPLPGPQQKTSNVIKSVTTRSVHTASPSAPERSHPETPSPVPPQNIAPGGIIITGGNVENPQVNNYRPSLPNISWNKYPVRIDPDLENKKRIDPYLGNEKRLDDLGNPEVSVFVTIGQTFYSPAFVAHCDVPCRLISQIVVTNGEFYSDAGTRFRRFASTTDPTVVGVAYLQPAMFPSGTTLKLEFRSLSGQGLTVTDFAPSYAP